MSLTTTFLIRGVGFDAGEVGVVNKTPDCLPRSSARCTAVY